MENVEWKLTNDCPSNNIPQFVAIYKVIFKSIIGPDIGMGTGDRSTCDTGLSIAVNRSETVPQSMRFGFLCTLEA